MSEPGRGRAPQGLYDPAFEHDACGVGFVANIRGERSHDVVHKGIRVLDLTRVRAGPKADSPRPRLPPDDSNCFVSW